MANIGKCSSSCVSCRVLGPSPSGWISVAVALIRLRISFVPKSLGMLYVVVIVLFCRVVGDVCESGGLMLAVV